MCDTGPAQAPTGTLGIPTEPPTSTLGNGTIAARNPTTPPLATKPNRKPSPVAHDRDHDHDHEPQRAAEDPPEATAEDEAYDDGLEQSGDQTPAARTVIEAADSDSPEDEDEFAIEDGYDTRSIGSTSASPSIYAHAVENGRRYQHFKNGRYPIPNDDKELDREDMKHAMLKELTDGKLYYAPIDENVQSIVDVGTGTGIWAMEIGDQFPSAKVRGIDLSPVQPLWVPPNVDFLVDDCEKGEWLSKDVDFVHLRFMTIVLKDVPTVLKRAHESLKSGGWIELQELCAEPLCDDGTMPPNDPVKYMYDLAGRAFSRFGMNVTLPKHLEQLLRDAGFTNIQCVVRKVPIGVWARDKTMRLIGMYQKLAVLELMPALAGRPFQALGLSPTESQVTLAFARTALEAKNVHRYFDYYFWFAQKQ